MMALRDFGLFAAQVDSFIKGTPVTSMVFHFPKSRFSNYSGGEAP
jgi:hypothetical protein